MKSKILSFVAVMAVTVGMLLGSFVDARANTSLAQGLNLNEFKASVVNNSTCHSFFGTGKYIYSYISTYGIPVTVNRNAYGKGGWSDNNFSNVEIWITGTVPSGCSAPSGVTGFTTPRLIHTGAYTAGTVYGGILTFENFINMSCAYHRIVFDTNINGVYDLTGMESCEWRSTLAGATEYQSQYKTFDTTDYTKLNGSNNLFGAKKNVAISGKYQIGVGSTALTSNCELYYFYQYWEGGVLKRQYLKQTGYADAALATSTTATPIYSKTKIEANKMVLAGTVDKVTGRTYYVRVDFLCDGVFGNSGYDIEIPAL